MALAAASALAADASSAAANTIALAGRAAACEEAEAAHSALDAKLEVLRSFLDAATRRKQDVEADVESLQARADALDAREREATARISMLGEGSAACEQRITLTKQLLQESGQKLEALRARGGVAEEMHREQTMQLGVLGERLLERSQQLKAQTFHCLEQRIRVGLGSWVKEQKQAEALERWRTAAAAQRDAKAVAEAQKIMHGKHAASIENKPLQLS